MARARKSSNDGMTMLGLMPFPAFNLMNWGALALPRNAMLASMHNTRLMLDAWRAAADSVRCLNRLHQDELLQWLETPMRQTPQEAEAAKPDGEAVETEAETAAALMMQPMLEATRAYGRVGRAFMAAQRDTIRAALADAEQPH